MSVSFTRTREQLRDMVLRKCRVLGIDQTPTAEQEFIVNEAIDLRLKEMHRLGVYWRKVSSPLSFTVTSGVNSASASVDILFPIALTLLDGAVDGDVDIINKITYAKIENKTDTGRPTKAVWNGSASFTFHPVPITTTTAKLTYEKIADDTAANTAPDVDVSMLRWLRDLVAYDVSDDMGVSEARITRFFKESQMAERNIRKLNVVNVDYATVTVDEYDRVPSDYA